METTRNNNTNGSDCNSIFRENIRETISDMMSRVMQSTFRDLDAKGDGSGYRVINKSKKSILEILDAPDMELPN